MAQNDTEGSVAEKKTTAVYLGNRKAVAIVDGERQALPGKRCTTMSIPPGMDLMEAFQAITSPQGVWATHSQAPAPAWVAADGPLAAGLTQLLAAQYPGVEIREADPEKGS